MKYLLTIVLVLFVGCEAQVSAPSNTSDNTTVTPTIMPSGNVGVRIAPGVGIDVSTGEVGPAF